MRFLQHVMLFCVEKGVTSVWTTRRMRRSKRRW